MSDVTLNQCIHWMSLLSKLNINYTYWSTIQSEWTTAHSQIPWMYNNWLIHRLQTVQNTAARIITRTKSSDHITPVLTQLHWLPVQQRIHYKLLLLTFKALHNQAPPISLICFTLISHLVHSVPHLPPCFPPPPFHLPHLALGLLAVRHLDSGTHSHYTYALWTPSTPSNPTLKHTVLSYPTPYNTLSPNRFIHLIYF